MPLVLLSWDMLERDQGRKTPLDVLLLLPLHVLSLPSALGVSFSAGEPPELVTSLQIAHTPSMLKEQGRVGFQLQYSGPPLPTWHVLPWEP